VWWVKLLFGLLLAIPAGASVPVVQLSHAAPQLSLTAAMSVAVLPASQPADPESFWNAPAIDTASWPAGRWLLQPGERVIGRMVLQSLRERDVYVLQVPLSEVDHVQVWYREQGKPWHAAEAGDRVPLSRWPFTGQFPAFPLAMSEEPLELIVTASNDAPMSLPIVIKTDAAYREGRLMQANVTGLAMGLGLMGAVFCLIAALTYRRRASWVLFGYAVWAFVLVACASGYTAIWLTPDWPAFNDKSKPVATAVMGALLVAVLVEVLDHIHLRPWVRWTGVFMLAASLVYAAAEVLWLPASARPAAAIAWAVACTVLSAALSLASHLRGGRNVALPALAITAFAAAIGLGYADLGVGAGIHWASLLSALLLFASAQLVRHGQFLRERHGRDVLGRAALSANRDPLTAVLSYSGLQHSYEEATLRQAAGRGPVAMLMFALPRLDECSLDHGFVLTERALVRFAAALQQVLGHEWAIGRLSKTRFGAVANTRLGPDGVVQAATHILSHCSRMHDPLSPVGDFDLRIVCVHRTESLLPFMDLLRIVEETAQGMTGAKRIGVVQATRRPPVSVSVPPRGAPVE
jgi:GGDEF domain-containing protein